MNKNIFRSISLAAALALLAAVPAAAQGTFHKFVAVGDSLIIGEQSNCVVERFQQRSWVTIAAELLGQTDFQQPFIQEVPATNPLTGYPCLGAVFTGTSVAVSIVSEAGQNQNIALPRPYDNLGFNGFPVIKDFVDLTVTHPGSSDLDNIAAPILRNCVGCPYEGKSAVDEANMLSPDLVAFWGGTNDALNAAFSGVAILGVTLTPPASFAASYSEVMAGLSASGRTLVTFNIPYVDSIPFATTIPPVVVNPATRQPVVVNGQLVPLLGPGDAAYPCTPVPPDKGCGLPPGSLVTLLASSLLGQGVGIPTAVGGTGLPLPNGSFTPPSTLNVGVVLYPDEVALIHQTTDAYNESIASAAAANGAVAIDANALLDRIGREGYEIGGLTFTKTFVTGGLFSYDGAHPSAIGYGIIADAFIQTVNAVKGTSYPRPNFGDILFTPNCAPGSFGCPVLQTGGASVVQGGPWDYSLETWSLAFSGGFSSHGLAVVMPEAPRSAASPASGRAPRTVSRFSDD